MTEIKDLEGIGPKTASDLKDAGRDTIQKLAAANPDNLHDYVDALGEKKAEDVVKKARDHMRGGGGTNRFKTGIDLEKEQEEMGTITTSSEALDGLLGGGVGVGYLTEAYGTSSSGKTQLAHQIAVNAQLPSEEGGVSNGNQVIFIDVEETFRADRIRDMAQPTSLDADTALENIQIATTTDLTDQEQAVKDARQLNLEQTSVIIIDSMVGHIRAEFEGRSEYGERADRLGSMLSDLQKIASNNEAAVFYTNQAGRDPSVQYGVPVYAYGGATMKHRSSFRLRLDSRGNKGFNAELIDSPNLPQEDIYFDVSTEGIVDNDE